MKKIINFFLSIILLTLRTLTLFLFIVIFIIIWNDFNIYDKLMSIYDFINNLF